MSSQPSATPTAGNNNSNNKLNKRGTNDQNTMHVADGLHVVVRLLPSTGLEGAFRVHVLPESLQHAGLKLGDVCEISSEDGSHGYGIAWRADDRMGTRPKNRPAKMTETIRSAFGFEEGSTVTIARTSASIVRADRIVLSDVTPPEYNKPDDVDDGCWRTRTTNLFTNCEALAPGIAFDVVGRRKFRKRFYIESIEAKNAPTESACLFCFCDNTQLIMPGAALANVNAGASSVVLVLSKTSRHGVNTTPIHLNNNIELGLDLSRIGGLLEQSRILNRQLRRLLHTTSSRSTGGNPNPPVLLHGYEGTGKSMLMNALAEMKGLRKVVRVDRARLTGGSISKNQAIIQDSFREAGKSQPALVLLDNLDTLTPTDDVAYSEILATSISSLSGQKVMIVASTRSPTSLNSTVSRTFRRSLELPIPDTEAREQILNVLQGKPMFATDTMSTAVAAQTHGFTGADIEALYGHAEVIAYDRYEEECEQQELARSPTPPAYEEVPDLLDGCWNGGAGSHPTSEVTLRDLKAALELSKPTALREIFSEKPKVRWEDIGGSETVKKSFDRIIGWPLLHKEVLERVKYPMPRGVLLYGPPGCSKTLTAQAVANTYNFNFIAIKGAELLSMYVGESERAVREVFRKAKTAAPCVIFFDEIDAIGSDRANEGTKGLNVLTTLLNEMDGFDTLRDVFILAATNKPESLDPALMRPGRFSKHVYLGPPGVAARKEILSIATRGVALSGDVDFDGLVGATEGYSGAEIVNIVQIAKTPAVERHLLSRHEEVRVTAEDFKLGLQEQKKGITKEMLEGYEVFFKKQ
ncbi:ATPase family 2 [Lecanosticta acicola]|uniref:ATPase family 2 n=1 Tax=Lecanosticta acicola TaxID=111012 RepID=A0AAI9EFR7_9PEZI|nr:ATPase family 2 [Lecanosticta acicola]